jgi:hypothetical protein
MISETREPKFFAAFGKTDYLRQANKPAEKLGFWDFLKEGIKPYGYLFSLAYQYSVFPTEDFPVLGDCGARKYRFDRTPKIRGQKVTAEWAAGEYSKYITVNQEKYLVAPDHLLMEELSAKEIEERREFNWTNAAKFLELVKTWPKTTAIAVVQGITTEERIQSGKELIELGYKAIGLGGLVHTGASSPTLLTQLTLCPYKST